MDAAAKKTRALLREHRLGWLLALLQLFACTAHQQPTMPSPITTDKAILFAKAWCKEARESFDDQVTVEPNGGFKGEFGAADIVYDQQTKSLMVYGLVINDVSTMVKYPELFADFERAGKRESYTLGEGQLFVLKTPIKQKEPQLTLRKVFTDGAMSPDQFVKEVDWLMQWSTHWRTQRSLAIMDKPEEELIREGAEIDAWARKNRPRPW